jgi:aryl-alcohol dehydrogenase-like predicted oxidoreductase
MWGMGNWSAEETEDLLPSLEYAVQSGCNFFDTAWQYGSGQSEQILGKLRKRNTGIVVATKVPPKNFRWPSMQHFTLDETFPPDHVFEYIEKSLKNLDMSCIDLLQFHVWEDEWALNKDWQSTVRRLKDEKLVSHVGISVNVWEPNNGVKALKTGLVDTVQVCYNIFDQAAEDRLFHVCDELNIGVIARVPFEYGMLTGKITLDTKWPDGDWRNKYFVAENKIPAVKHVDMLRPIVPEGMTMAEMTLRFILFNKSVSTVIPGMRSREHVQSNLGCSDGKVLPAELVAKLRDHRWDRAPIYWAS